MRVFNSLFFLGTQIILIVTKKDLPQHKHKIMPKSYRFSEF